MIIELLLAILFTLLLVALLIVKPEKRKEIKITWVDKLTGKYKNEVLIGKGMSESAVNLMKAISNLCVNNVLANKGYKTFNTKAEAEKWINNLSQKELRDQADTPIEIDESIYSLQVDELLQREGKNNILRLYLHGELKFLGQKR